jgi:signal peptidase II
MLLLWGIAAFIFFADFCIKTYLRTNFAHESIPVIKNILHITVIFNPGAAFGILQGKTNFLIYIGIIFILIFFAFAKKEKRKDLLFLVACGLIVGGALSNLWDRIFLGYVVDYIDIRVWPVFNLSDSCITVGACLIFLDSFRKKKSTNNSVIAQS